MSDIGSIQLTGLNPQPPSEIKLRGIVWSQKAVRVDEQQTKADSIPNIKDNSNVNKVTIGKVPANKQDLLSIKGVGPKTANVVLNFAFNKPFIPIDSNTIRISNRLGWISSNKPLEVEKLLINNLEEDFLKEANSIFMLHGKKICVPVSPFCSKCPVEKYCMKIGVEKRRGLSSN